MSVRPGSIINSVRLLPAAARAGAAGVLVAALATSLMVSAAAATPAGQAGTPAGRVPAGTQAGWDAATGDAIPARPDSPVSTVALVTGDVVRLDTAGGQPHATLVPPAGGRLTSPDFTQFSLGGDLYVIPDEAVPYLGSVLDPRLFDVSYLARAHLGVVPPGAAHGSAIPVTLSYPGSVAPRLPGLQVTQAAGGTAAGTFAPAQGGQFARLLASHWRAGPAGLPGIGRLSLAPPPGAPPLPVSPFQAGAGSAPGVSGPGDPGGLPFHRLTLNFLGPDGKPGALALGIVQNVDNAALDAVLVEVTGGTISLSLPAGTYSVAFSVLTPHQGTYLGYDAALVAQPQVEVDADQTLTMDARAAVPYHPTLTGSTPPAGRVDILDYTRGSVTGGAVDSLAGVYLYLISMSGGGFAATDLSATPSAPVTKGTFAFTGMTQLSNSPLASSPDPTYTFSFPSDGRIPRSLTYQVPLADTTAVHSRFYQAPGPNPCGSDYLGFLMTQPWQPGHSTASVSLELQYQIPPGSRTDYIYDGAPPLDHWYLEATTTAGGICHNWQPTTAVRVQPGHQISVAWNKAPLVPSPVTPLISVFAGNLDWAGSGTVCPACRQGDVADLTLISDADSEQHYDGLEFYPGQPSTSLQFYRNGSLAVTSGASCSVVISLGPGSSSSGSGNGKCWLGPLGTLLPMLPGTATYRLDWGLTQTGPASVDTSWTFRSGPADPVLRRLPGPEKCDPDPAAGCSLLPLLFLGYDLPLNLDSQAIAGEPFRVAFTAGYQQNAPAARGVTASVSASFDGGKTWSAPVRASALGGGRFAVTVSQPKLSATSGFASLRVTARDAAGNSVTQTIIDAYGLTS